MTLVKLAGLKLKVKIKQIIIPEARVVLFPEDPFKLLPVLSNEKSKDKKSKPKKEKKYLVKELISLPKPPDGMDASTWEKKISIERLVSVYRDEIKAQWNYDVPPVLPKERACFRQFFSYSKDLRSAVELMRYIIENWAGMRFRYRLSDEYPCGRTFAYSDFIRQVSIEFNQKLATKKEEPRYILDEGIKDEPGYQSDW